VRKGADGGAGDWGVRDLPVRKNIRLKGYDYSRAGYYFVTICVKDGHEMLGKIVGAGSSRPSTQMIELTGYGEIVKEWLAKIPAKFTDSAIDCYVIMPNHIHFVLHLSSEHQQKESGRDDPAPTISRIIGYFKYQTTKQINIPGFWQRSYHERIIRSETEYQRIWQYINENPVRWAEDEYYHKGGA
jgi:REP element-mobilizing transposase RayT